MFTHANAAQALGRLLADKTVHLSSRLKPSGVLEVVVYGLRSHADSIGDMLLDHDCFLQQPSASDVGALVYYNPQCFIQNPDGSTPMWHADDNPEDDHVRPSELSDHHLSEVNKLLDSAAGPEIVRRVDVSDMLSTPLKE